MKKGIAILGSTGSIGTQTLQVIDSNPEHFSIELLSAHNNVELLVKQAIQYVPNIVIVTNPDHYTFLKTQLQNFPIKVFAGIDSVVDAIQLESIDIVLTAMVGYAGLLPTIKAIEAGKNIALANKETLVVAGSLINKLAIENRVNIIPVDSEHSAIFQCLTGENPDWIEKIILTASGGPFRGKSMDFLKNVSPEQALQHPNWCMGNKITIDSASLMNKGLEAIEAKWLFGLKPEEIEIVVHPQSIIHSMVQFKDGSVKAQMGEPDMRMPIHYALAFPERLPSTLPRLDFTKCSNLTFEAPDPKKFRNLAISFEAMKKGGNWPCLMNAANEIVVDAFLKGKAGFLEMPEIIEKVLVGSSYLAHPNYDDLKQSDSEARLIAKSLIR
ncbi:MAG: 1-deoxy-D-xylulose-5-phosphate reductoisomerase [Bacteroidales bacterium]|nr:1-deoxy-D-xylulose-5-phosphate reductoisomerase [Bacteroidales bacterium]MCF8406072.1 1-deoxy-D-xylulose-5-phosphate reductoisomerase [Bacteroidales bacterium]